MEIHPKALMSEILSGFVLLGLLLWSYFQVHPVQLNWILSPPPNGSTIIVSFSAAGFLISWIIGRLLGTIRDGFVERLFDSFSQILSGEQLNWDFFFNKDREKVEQLNDWYYSYYCLNINLVIGISSFFVIELVAWQTRCEFISPLPLGPNVILLIVMIIFFIGAISLRNEIKRLVKEQVSICPHQCVYVRLKPSPIHGVGVFAICDIPKGTKIFSNDDSEMTWINKADIGNIDSELKRLYDDFCVLKDGNLGCPKNFNMLTVGWYLNNSKDNPNVRCIDNYDFIALRDIKKGEELIVDYSTYSERPKGIILEQS